MLSSQRRRARTLRSASPADRVIRLLGNRPGVAAPLTRRGDRFHVEAGLLEARFFDLAQTFGPTGMVK